MVPEEPAVKQETPDDNSQPNEQDPNIVDWDGPEDPANPLNWSKFLRYLHIILVSLFTLYALVSPSLWPASIIINPTSRNLAASMFAPGAQQLVSEFHVINSTIAAFTITIYVLGFAIGPLLLAPLSELYGRLVIYHICGVFYFAFSLGCALSKDVAMFLVFRFICGCAGSGPMSIGGGTIADVTSQNERGKAMALFATGPLLGPVLP